MIAANYKTKKDLKNAIGREFQYTETSLHGAQWKPDTMLTVVGPSAYERKWYAQVWCDASGKVVRVK